MDSYTVLYVCVHNAGRSQMAEAITNHLADKQGISVRAISAGTSTRKELNAVAVQAVSELGISMEGQVPKLLTQEMVDEADMIVSMGCGVDTESCPARFLLTEDWGLDDPAGQNIEVVRKIRDEIIQKVESLLLQVGK